MTQSIETTVHDRKVVVTVPDDIPDGTRVELRFVPAIDQIGIDESEWRNDADAVKDWNHWLTTIEPIDFPEPDDFDRKFAEFNVQAVREQMFGDKK